MTLGGAGPLPWTAIDRYCQVQKFEPDFAQTFHRVLRAMDNAYLEAIDG